VRRLALGLLLLLLAALLALWLWRVAAAQWLAGAAASRLGLQGAEVRVVSVGWGESVLGPVRLGADLSVERVALAYRPLELLAGRLARVEARGLRLDLDAAGGGTPARLAEALGGGEAGGPPGPLPALRLDDAEIAFALPQGRLVLGVTADVAGGAGAQPLAARLALATPWGSLGADLDGGIDAAQGEGALDLKVDGGPLALPGFAVARISGGGRVVLHPGRWPDAAFELAATGATVAGQPTGDAALTLRWHETGGDAALRLPGAAGGDGLAARVQATAGDGRPPVALEASGDLAGLPVLWRLAGQAPPEGGRLPFRLAVDALPDPAAALPGEFAGWLALAVDAVASGTLDLAAEELRLAGSQIDGRLRLEAHTERDGIALRLAAPIDLAAAGGSFGRVALRAVEGEPPLVWLSPGDGARVEARLSFELAGGPLPPVGFEGRFRHGGGRTVLAGDLTAPQQDLAAEGLDLVAVAEGEATALTLALRALRSTAALPAFAPLKASGRARLTAGRLDFELAPATADGKVQLAVSGRHTLASGAGEARLALPPLRLGAGGVALAALLPRLAGVEAEGGVSAEAELAWGGAAGLRGNGVATLRDLTLGQPGARIEGLAGRVVFDRLVPPSTPPGQRLTARSLDAGGLPLGALDVRLRLLAPGTRLLVERAELGFAGGRVITRGAVLDPAAPETALTVEFDGVGLDGLAALAGLPGLTAEGRLDGSLPVRIAGDRIAVAEGRLAARGSGRLAYVSPEADAAAAAEPNLQLALKALEDFRYDVLELRIDKQGGGEGAVALRLEGRNPGFMDGQPFRFNVNLEATRNVERVLRELLAGYRLSEGILADIVR